jgi:molecular chaperone GrpE
MNEKLENKNIISQLESHAERSQAPEEGESGTPRQTEELEKTLAAKKDEVQTLQDKYIRLAAEFENYKKLAQKEQRECTRFANERILKELLPIGDNLERAIRSARDARGRGNDGLIQGIELTLKQFVEVLAKFGVRQITSVGEPFDPSCHQAVARKESDAVPENTVTEEHQKGYYLHDRILRAAMVTVATPPTGSQKESGGAVEGNGHGAAPNAGKTLN